MDDLFGFDSYRYRMRFMWDMAIRDPRSQMIAPKINTGPKIIESEWVRDGGIYMTKEDVIVVGKYNRFGERQGVQALTPRPFWTRHMLGVSEGARDRRRRWKGRR